MRTCLLLFQFLVSPHWAEWCVLDKGQEHRVSALILLMFCGTSAKVVFRFFFVASWLDCCSLSFFERDDPQIRDKVICFYSRGSSQNNILAIFCCEFYSSVKQVISRIVCVMFGDRPFWWCFGESGSLQIHHISADAAMFLQVLVVLRHGCLGTTCLHSTNFSTVCHASVRAIFW